MNLSCLLAFVVLIFVHGVYCDSECDCNTNKELMELIHKDYLQMRLENFKIMSRLRRLEISKQSVSTQSDPITAKGESQSKAVDGLDMVDAYYANIKAQSERIKSMEAKITNITAQSERIKSMEAKITNITEQSENMKQDIEVKLAKASENKERIDKIEHDIMKIEDKLEVMNRNEASSSNGYKKAFYLRNFVSKGLLAEKTSRLMFVSDIRNQVENIKHSFSEFKTETVTLVHNQSVSLSTKHEAFTEQMTRQAAEVNHQMHTDIDDITLELKKITEDVAKMNTEISTLNEITIEDKTDGAWSSWSSWGSCSVTCGGGIRSHSRTCTNPKPSILGKYCDGAITKVSICNKQTCPEHMVAFTAYGISGSATAIFSTVLQQNGNGYNKSTGVFHCTVPGIYYFSFQLSKHHVDKDTADFVSCYIYLNSTPQVGAIQDPHIDDSFKNDYSGYSISLSGTFHLNTNDTVYIGGCSGISAVFTDNRASFTGFLVIPEN